MSTPLSRRRLLGLAGGAALALTPLGCGGGGGSGGSQFSQPKGDVPGQYAKRQRVVVWYPYSGVPADAFNRLVGKFNESQQDVYLEAQFQGTYDEVSQKLAAGLQARQIPELCIFSEVTWHRFHLNQTLEPMTGYFDNDFSPTGYVDSLINEGTVRNEVWWVPFGRSTPLFYYNRDMFAKAGLPDRGPKTWDELREWAPALRKVSVGGRAPRLHAYPRVDGDWMFQGAVWQWGGNYSRGMEVAIDTGGAVEAGEWQRRLIHQDKLAYMTESPRVDFTNGLIATLQDSTGVMTTLTKEAKFAFGAAFLPEQKAFGCPTGGGGLAMLAGPPKERKEAAFEFIRFAARPENVAQWSVDTGYLPSTKAAQQTPELQKLFTERPGYKVAVDQLPKTQAQDQVRLLVPNANKAIYGGLQKIYADNQPAQQVFSAVAEELRKNAESVKDAVAKYS
ncbi:ABC transporter substrate-binding protein [Plantactinospora solaniradicis]|uniref:ABC transporter substrate-binding protein n=1 Tax=Plantactinospora solaniradicis TaxID=1723736 RepID=A0ABW1K338_9ACTN